MVHIGHYRRNIMLPQLLAPMSVSEARLDQDMLTLSFKGARKGQTASKTTKGKG